MDALRSLLRDVEFLTQRRLRRLIGLFRGQRACRMIGCSNATTSDYCDYHLRLL